MNIYNSECLSHISVLGVETLKVLIVWSITFVAYALFVYLSAESNQLEQNSLLNVY